jgi:hypothetical protein
MTSADPLDELLLIKNERVFNEKARERILIESFGVRFFAFAFPRARSEQQRCLNHLPIRPVL